MVEAVNQRDQIRDELIEFATGFLGGWESYADKEFRSNELGFEFVSRQTLHEGLVMTVSKASVPGLTLEQHAHYRANIPTLMPKLDPDGKISITDCPDFEG